MKSLKLLMIIAVSSALFFTSPAFADTGPPAPITKECIKEKKISVFNLENYAVACPDVGATAISELRTDKDVGQVADLEKAEAALYLDKPERSHSFLYGYKAKRPCKAYVNKMRPPIIYKE